MHPVTRLVCSGTYINFTLAMTKNVGIDDGYDADVYDLVSGPS